uniref:Uncharacterized protein n=1 Tax=Rhizophora mucronata TaxID=61149 RepID=A0A2P2MKZ1_RHIMU
MFKNPLHVPISISSVSLVCELSGRSDETKSDPDSTSIENLDKEEFRKSGDKKSDSSIFTLSEVNFSLGGHETNLVSNFPGSMLNL